MEQTNVRLRPFKLGDTEALTRWGTHDDPRFYQYNFPYCRSSDLERWYAAKKVFFKRWIYAIEVNYRVVGYITLKNISWMQKKGEMGIAIDPNYLGRGIGTRAICLYLHRVFRNFIIDEIHLKTAEFNTRAITCYENIGFEHIEKKREPFEEQSFRKDILREYPDFDHDKKNLYVNYCYMKISKSAFIGRYIKKTE
ncbi:GNAT family N-acetyltransferase [Fusibacter sp. JL216-2]|uniref:GNAT family N-acetyltransferase n=1 Tax=Fusibacter sp. JL216-2 TaxID=3071453 RepID=UPI003D334CD2